MAKILNGRWVLKALVRDANSPYLYGRVRDLRNGKVHTFSTKTGNRKKAEQVVLDFIHEQEAKEKHELTTNGAVLGDALAEWIKHKDVRDVTRAGYEIDRQLYVRTFEGMLVHEVEASSVENFLTGLRKAGRTSRTCAKHLVALRSFFRWALRRRYCSTNPAEGIKVGRGVKVEKIALTPEEARGLLAKCRERVVLAVGDGRRRDWQQSFAPPPYLFVSVAMACYTGLRRKNIFGLRWRDVDMGARKITLEGDVMKNHSPHSVPIHPALHALFESILKAEGKVEPDAPVIGEQVKVATIALYSACRRAEIPPIGWHTLRHSFASWLAVSSACSFNCLRELLGHKPMTVTSIYTHSTWEERVKAIASLPALLQGGAMAEGPEEQRQAASRI